MSSLLVDMIVDSLEQEITISFGERTHIAALIPCIYINNSPAGTFTFELIKSSVTIFSRAFTCADIKTALGTTNNYLYAYYPIIPTGLIVLENGAYTVKITASGYTWTETSYIAWVVQHENLQNGLSYTPTSDRQNPLTIRFKTWNKE